MTKTTKSSRRDVLKAGPLAAIGYVAVAGASSADEPAAAPLADDNRDVRLADSDHVRAYYRLARG